ncbi:hypothetical protein FH972_024463 [Carpinus fangiana]|uniref:Ubiquitin carboxyl-terminal hydrolase n=1 Tax=Carpinus fangiana TaxID=176857 RepID=A0A5N6KY39_9ROSI|nr:hypothetical protein FH972_024463 [Carpinus fangiana]
MNPMISSDLDIAGTDPEQDLDEKQQDEVTDITPESLDADVSDSVSKQGIRADDIEAMKEEYFKPLPELEIEHECEYTWDIEEWSKLGRRVHSPAFEVGGAPWKVLFFPAGNQPDHASFYLEQGFEDKPPEDWYACVHFMLVLWNPNDPTIQIRHIAQHRYNIDESDWGFTRFGELRKLFHGRFNDTNRPLVENDGAKLTAFVRIMKDPTGVLWHTFINYDSKKQTGMVGLKNQGATCYLNSLIQSLYFTNLFRKAIFQIPTESETEPSKNSAYALQRLFFNLQSHNAAISTSELTTAFGWDSSAIFQQQDVQELTRILMDKMEERMKGTPYDNALKDMFRGYFRTYIDCINVDFTSERTEEFWDLQLDVRGNPTLADSFKSYIQVETLDGDNKYQAEGFGLQDARKGVIFEAFPPVLHLQLKRYEFDLNTLQQTKVHDRIEFAEEMDLAPYLSEKADKSEDWTYQLHGVLVHSGDLDAGHYYAFIKPTKDGIFYKFDDDRVTPATQREAMEENFGGDFAVSANGITTQRNPYTKSLSKQRQMSAYMLVYIRKSRVDRVLQDIAPTDVPTHLEEKILEEKAELDRKRKEREEAHLYQQVYFGTDEEFNAHQGHDIFPMVTAQTIANPLPGSPRFHRVLKTMEVSDLTKLIATEIGVDEDLVRPWAMVGRQNLTLRPDTPLVAPDLRLEDTPSRFQAKIPLRYWVEVTQRRPDGTPDFHPIETLSTDKNIDAPILLFLKQFDPLKQNLSGHGHVFISRTKKIQDLGPIILERMGWPEGTKIQLFEVKVHTHHQVCTQLTQPRKSKPK